MFKHQYDEEAELRDGEVGRVSRMPALLAADAHTHAALMNHACAEEEDI